MKFTIENLKGHCSFGACVQWINERYLITTGDDHLLIVWDSSETLLIVNQIKLADDCFPTSLAVQLNLQSKSTSEFNDKTKSIADVHSNELSLATVVVGSSNGQVHFVHLGSKRIVKQLSCHQGAITCLQFSDDGSALLTGSEDGQLKVWSGNGGLLRCTLATHAHPIHCGLFIDPPSVLNASSTASKTIAKSTSSQAPYIAYSLQDQLIITSLAPNAQPVQTVVHRGHIIRKLIYSNANRQLITNDECGCIRVYDLFGKQTLLLNLLAINCNLNCSRNGKWIAIENGGKLQLLSSFGQQLAIQMLKGASRALQFDPLNRSIAVLQLNGSLSLLRLSDIRIEYAQFSLNLHSNTSASFACANNSFEQTLDYAGSYIRHAQFGHRHLLLVLDAQCLNYPLTDKQEQALGTPASVSFNIPIHLALQSEKLFALIDCRSLCSIFDHHCRKVQSIRNVWPTNQLFRLTDRFISLNSKHLLILDAFQANQMRFYSIDLINSSSLSSSSSSSSSRAYAPIEYSHSCDILRLSLCQQPTHQTWTAAILDNQQQLFLIRIPTLNQKLACVRLQSGCVDISWHEQVPILICLQTTSVQTLLAPLVSFTDSQLLSDSVQTKLIQNNEPQLSNIQFCTDGFVSVCCVNGISKLFSLNCFAILAQKYLQADRVQETLSLARQCKGEHFRAVWSVITCYSLLKRDLSVALQGYVALRHSVKVMYLDRLQKLCDSLPDPKSVEIIRASEVALLCAGDLEQAEQFLLQGGFVIRIVLMYLQAFRWEQAFKLALKFDQKMNETHWKQLELQESNYLFQRLVLTHRLDFLERFERNENRPEFKRLADELTPLDESTLEKFERNQYTFCVKLN